MIRLWPLTGENDVDLTGTKTCYVEPKLMTVLYCTRYKAAVLARVPGELK